MKKAKKSFNLYKKAITKFTNNLLIFFYVPLPSKMRRFQKLL